VTSVVIAPDVSYRDRVPSDDLHLTELLTGGPDDERPCVHVNVRVRVHVHDSAALTGGGYTFRRGRRFHVVIDPALDPRTRREVLTHELVHLRRRSWPDRDGLPSCWDPVIRREELRVDREVARRLVPVAQLRALVTEARRADTVVTAADVAEAFEVTTDVAVRALQDLARAAPDRDGVNRSAAN
jgi:hypothetical protein